MKKNILSTCSNLGRRFFLLWEPSNDTHAALLPDGTHTPHLASVAKKYRSLNFGSRIRISKSENFEKTFPKWCGESHTRAKYHHESGSCSTSAARPSRRAPSPSIVQLVPEQVTHANELPLTEAVESRYGKM